MDEFHFVVDLKIGVKSYQKPVRARRSFYPMELWNVKMKRHGLTRQHGDRVHRVDSRNSCVRVDLGTCRTKHLERSELLLKVT